jgi:hypothetical protein
MRRSSAPAPIKRVPPRRGEPCSLPITWSLPSSNVFLLAYVREAFLRAALGRGKKARYRAADTAAGIFFSVRSNSRGSDYRFAIWATRKWLLASANSAARSWYSAASASVAVRTRLGASPVRVLSLDRRNSSRASVNQGSRVSLSASIGLSASNAKALPPPTSRMNMGFSLVISRQAFLRLKAKID